MKDEEIIDHIRRGKTEGAIRQLYKEFPKVRARIVSSGGRKDEARETFHDALILLIEKVQNPQFESTSKLSTFLFGICRFLWLNKARKKQGSVEIAWPEAMDISSADLDWDPAREDKLNILEKVLQEISVRCREIFSRFYTQKQSMAEIASEMGFSGMASAKTQKYKCIEHAMKLAANYEPEKA